MRLQLIENWADALWKAWSIRLAALAGVLAGWATTDPQGWQHMVELLPEPLRPLVGVLVFIPATGTRLVKQDTKNG